MNAVIDYYDFVSADYFLIFVSDNYFNIIVEGFGLITKKMFDFMRNLQCN